MSGKCFGFRTAGGDDPDDAGIGLGGNLEEEFRFRFDLVFVHVHFHKKSLRNASAMSSETVLVETEWLALQGRDALAPGVAEPAGVEQVLVSVQDVHLK